MLTVSNNTTTFGQYSPHNPRIVKQYVGSRILNGTKIDYFRYEAKRGKQHLCYTNPKGKILVKEKSIIGADTHEISADARDYYREFNIFSRDYWRRRKKVLAEKKFLDEIGGKAWKETKTYIETGKFPF